VKNEVFILDIEPFFCVPKNGIKRKSCQKWVKNPYNDERGSQDKIFMQKIPKANY
jgi:hypothetical protein